MIKRRYPQFLVCLFVFFSYLLFYETHARSTLTLDEKLVGTWVVETERQVSETDNEGFQRDPSFRTKLIINKSGSGYSVKFLGKKFRSADVFADVSEYLSFEDMRLNGNKLIGEKVIAPWRYNLVLQFDLDTFAVVGEYKYRTTWNGTEYDKNGNITGKYVNGKWIKQ